MPSMKEFNFEGALGIGEETVITVGCFDGVHIGHASLFKEVFRLEAERKLKSTVASFFKLPFKGKELMTGSEKRERFKRAGFQNLIILDFCDSFSRMTAVSFLERLFMIYGMRALVEGEDFRCGRDAEWGKSEIEEWCAKKGVECVFLPSLYYKGERLSSTLIRRLIRNGKIEEAKRLLV